jgi:hypothetical protein
MQGPPPQGGGAPQPAQQGAGDQQQAGQALQQIATTYLQQGRPVELAKQIADLFCQASGIEAQMQQQGGGGQPAGGPPQGDPNAGGAPAGGPPQAGGAPQGGPESMAKGGKMKRKFSLPGKGGKTGGKGMAPPFQRGSIGAAKK